jgi:hypothetical protein
MKKLLLSVLALATFSASAQVFEDMNIIKKDGVDFKKTMSSYKGGPVSGYLDYNALILDDFGGSSVADDGFQTMSIDSTTLVYYSNDTVWNTYHGFGAIYDATNPYFANAFAAGDVVTLDSIYWAGWYDIFDASANDSMKISIVTDNPDNLPGGVWPSGYWSYLPGVQPLTADMAYTGSTSNGAAGGLDNPDVTFTIPMSQFVDGFQVFSAVVPNGFSWNAEDAIGILFEYKADAPAATDTMFLVDDTATFNPYFQYLRVDPWDGSQYTGMFMQLYDTTVTTTSNFLRSDERYILNTGTNLWRNERTSNQPWVSNEIWLKVSGTSSVGLDENGSINYRIFPNPSNGVVNLELGANTTAQVRILDVLGQTVMASNETFVAGERKSIDLSNMAKGMYLITVKGEGINIVERVTLK